MDEKSGPVLRPVTDEDRPFLQEVFFTSLQRNLAAAGLTLEQQQAFVAHQFEAQDSSYRSQSPNANFDLILIDNKPAGRIYIDRRQDDIGLMEMTLLPCHQNQGIGTSLIKDLLEEAQELHQSVGLYVEHWNPDARRLYLRLGFQDEEDIGTHWKMRWNPQ